MRNLAPGDGAFRPHADYQADLTALSIVTGDFNADGVPDLAVANGSSRSVSVLLGNGDGTFQSAVGYSTGGNTYAYSVATGDFTGDGGADLTVATEVGASVLLNSPVAALFPAALVFGSQALGTASVSQAVPRRSLVPGSIRVPASTSIRYPSGRLSTNSK